MRLDPEIIGYFAAIFTTAAYVPQTIKIFRHRHTASLSLWMYVMISIGIAAWLVYGVMIESPSLIAANGISLVLTLSILAMKIRNG